MLHITKPVSRYMTSDVVQVEASARLPEVHRLLVARRISCIPVIDARGQPVGVLSRTDLLRLGRFETKDSCTRPLLTLPDIPAADVLRPGVFTVGPTTQVGQAAGMLLKHRIHRVFVREGDQLVGVFSTKDLLLALIDARISVPISELMSTPVLTVSVETPIARAAEMLYTTRTSGLVVVTEGGWPVGMFTQTEALLAQGVRSDSPVEEVMSPALLCLGVRTPLFHAAAQTYATRVRRVLAVKGRRALGLLTGMDFARAANPMVAREVAS